MLSHRPQSGFTLIEMMIVVAIMGIIAAFAYPSYVEQVRKSKRSDAKVALQQIAQRQESHFVKNYSYATSLTALGYAADTIPSPENEYDITISAATATSYILKATPASTSGQAKDSQCASFTLDQMGRRVAKNSSDVVMTDQCWR
ncbi:type IV pilus assembly protein PilE [Thiothrix eikelboomii]|uniref:Type IV pilus assembly protein PilE n=1 Tax=Thiothrix eikelboomii TaxID=92487 RepID=A0A1T4XSE6_9GAMM|nr:type IV pilin protein [Thiothrix eikelboomii]SKA92454.1 type IV pilus assembly protein PilE [Thiothrix eikelboomii]